MCILRPMFFFSSRRRHTRCSRDWSSDVCSSDLARKLATSRHIVCASPAYLLRHGRPDSPADLKKHICIGYSYAPHAEEWRFTDDRGKTHDVKISIGMQSNNCDTVRAAALAGRGIILQPTFM